MVESHRTHETKPYTPCYIHSFLCTNSQAEHVYCHDHMHGIHHSRKESVKKSLQLCGLLTIMSVVLFSELSLVLINYNSVYDIPQVFYIKDTDIYIYTYVCMCVHVYIYTHTYACTHAYAHTHIHTYAHTHMLTHMPTHKHTIYYQILSMYLKYFSWLRTTSGRKRAFRDLVSQMKEVLA